MNIDYRQMALTLALQDFEKFCRMAGVNMMQFKICTERERGLSLQQIATKLGVTKDAVYTATKKCAVSK